MVCLDHVAILVESVDKSLQLLKDLDFETGEINVYPGEGTKEVYTGSDNQSARLLLIEAIAEGPYQKALFKRGTGLHHIAINVNSFDDYLEKLNESGWYLHLHSWQSQKHHTLWLSRAGLPLLIELNEIYDESVEKNCFIKTVQWDYSGYEKLIDRLGLTELKKGKDMLFETEKHTLSLLDIL